MESSQTVSKVLNRIRNVFWSVFVNDALCAPVHWYYDLEALQKDYGWVDTYVDPKEVHPLTLKYPMLKKSDDPTVDIVGKHILHNKREIQQKKGCHYHSELKAGDTTLNADIMLVAMKEIINAKDKTNSWDANAFLEAYIKFLTTPDTHNDTYFESVHYTFVTNWLRKNPLDKCAGDEKSVAPAAAVFKFVIPALFAPLLDQLRASKAKGDDKFEFSNELKDKCVETAVKQTALLYSGDRIKKDVENFFRVLLAVVSGADMVKSIEEIGGKYFKKNFADLAKDERSDNEIVGEEFHNACDTNGSLPLAYFVCTKYANDFNKAILVNANMGGENLGRGSVIGPLLSGWKENLSEDNEWVKKLNRKDEYKKVIEDFITL